MKNKLTIGTILISSFANNVYAQLSSETLQIIQSKRQEISQIDQVVRSNATESIEKKRSAPTQTQTGQTQTGNRIVLGSNDSTSLGSNASFLQYIAPPAPVNGGSIFVGNCSPATKPTSTKPALCPTGLTGTAEMSRNVSCFDGNWNAGPWLVNDINYGNCIVPADCFMCDGTINPNLSFSRKAACQKIADGSSSRGLGTVNLPNCIVPTPAPPPPPPPPPPPTPAPPPITCSPTLVCTIRDQLYKFDPILGHHVPIPGTVGQGSCLASEIQTVCK